MPGYAGPISVTSPVGLAIDHVKRMLFQPFDLGRWLTIGFCAWLACLGENGGFGGGLNWRQGRDLDRTFRQSIEHAREYVMENLAWIVPLLIGAVLVGIALSILFTWLSSRGKFMFLYCVATNRAEVRRPWSDYAALGNSLFWFRLVVGLITFVPIGLGVAILILLIVRLSGAGSPTVALLLPLIAIIVGLILISTVLFLVFKLTRDFVVPIMYLRRKLCLDAWRELLALISPNLGNIVLYFLFQIVLSLAIGAMVVVVVLVTCCVAGCLLALPYIGTVLLLPVLIFSRAYSLYYLAQFGTGYDVFLEASPNLGT